MKGTINSVRKVAENAFEVTVATDNGGEEALTINDAKAAKKFAVGTEVTYELKKVRKPRAKNGEGAKPRKSKKAAE